MKVPALSGDHWAGTGSRGFRVPARRRKLLETVQTAGSNQNRINLNIFRRIYSFVQIFVGFSKANILEYSFMIWLYLRMYSEFHLSNIYDSKYIWIFIVSQKRLKKGSFWSKMVKYGSKITQNIQMSKIVQNNIGQIFRYSNMFVFLGQIYSFIPKNICWFFFLIKFIWISIRDLFIMPNIFRYSFVQYLW